MRSFSFFFFLKCASAWVFLDSSLFEEPELFILLLRSFPSKGGTLAFLSTSTEQSKASRASLQ